MTLADDPRDRELLRNVHPSDWSNPSPRPRYDLVVVGAGTAGLISAAGAAGLGAKVALVEREHMGGDCLNVGCVPSKALLRSAHLAASLRDAERFGLRLAGEPGVDFGEVMRRVREVRARISPVDSVQRYSGELGVDVFLGEGRFASPSSLEVGGARLRFKKAVVATGARPLVPPIEGLEEAGYLTNETVFDLTERPRRLLVLGGGPIGCELAQAFRRLGSEVTLVELDSRLLAREDPDAAALVQAALERDGVDLRLGTRLTRLEPPAPPSPDAARRASLECAGRQETLPVDAVLVAVGRRPNVEGLGLEAAGVEVDPQGNVVVDDRLRTSSRRIFAAGDVCMEQKFTHAADYAARIVIRNALFFGRQRLSGLIIPRCTYTAPELAQVGLSARDAAARDVPLDTWTRELADVDRALTEGETEGFVRIHTRKGRDEILGATIVGAHAGDLIGEVAVAMAAGMGLAGLSNVIHPYPTRADAIRQLGGAYMRTRLTPLVERVFGWILRLQS